MSMKENGGPAFPCVETVLDQDGCDLSVLHHGLSIRDYFAAKATDDDIQEIMQKHRNNPQQPVDSIVRGELWVGLTHYTITRQQARYMHADAMLSERAK